MRLKNYGRNQKKRKEYIHQSGLFAKVSKSEDVTERVTYLFMDVVLGFRRSAIYDFVLLSCLISFIYPGMVPCGW